MNKTLKFLFIALAAVLVLLVAGIGIIAATIHPNDYKPLIIRQVQEKTQRTLTIPGDIKPRFFPKLGINLGELHLSERNSKGEFATIKHVSVSLALLPLLKKELVADQVIIDGLQAHLQRYADGRTNIDDLLPKHQQERADAEEGGRAEKAGGQIRFDIDSVDISHTKIVLDDQQQGRHLSLANLMLKTGKLANGVPSQIDFAADIKGDKPLIDANVKLKSGITFDIERKHYVLNGIDANLNGKLLDFSGLALKLGGNADLRPEDKRVTLNGIKLSTSGKQAARTFELRLDAPQLAITDTQVSGGKFDGDAKLVEGPRTITAHVTAPSFEGTPQAFKLPSLALDAAIKDATLDAKVNMGGMLSGDIDQMRFESPQWKLVLSGKQGATALDGTLTTPVSANLKTGLIELPAMKGTFTLPNPGGGALKLTMGGSTRIDLKKHTASAHYQGKLDESSFDAKLGLSHFSPPVYTFDIGIDRIDADRYQAKPAAAAQKPQPSRPAGGGSEKPLDLSALQTMRANGALRVGALKLKNLKLNNLRADIRVADGWLDINPISVALYDGSASGSVSATGGKAPRFALHQKLTGVRVGPLLQDALGKQPIIEGRGNVTLDVTTAGGVFAQMKKNLDGSMRLELRDGAIHGVNLAQTIRNAKAKIGELRGGASAQSGTGSSTEKTDFSEMSGSFKIANGVAHNDDLNAKSPLIRLGGNGDIDLGNERLDYLVRATVVSTLQGQGGPELQALKGLTVPVRLSGPFTAIGWSVDFEGLARELAKGKIEEQKSKIEEKARGALEKELKGLFGK